MLGLQPQAIPYRHTRYAGSRQRISTACWVSLLGMGRWKGHLRGWYATAIQKVPLLVTRGHIIVICGEEFA